MSIHRLNSFIKENFHDVIDYWIERQKVRYVRVISRKTGRLFMLRVADFNIEYDVSAENRDPFMKTQVLHLESVHIDDRSHSRHGHEDGTRSVQKEDDVPATLYKLYDTFLSAFPEHRHRFVLHQSDYFIETRTTVFRIANYPSDAYYNFYLHIDLEWFYENLYIVNHEIERSMTGIEYKSTKMYTGFIPMYTNVIRSVDKDLSIIQSTWTYYEEQINLLSRTTKFFVSICNTEYQYQNELLEMNNMRTESLSFHDTIRRSHRRKILHEKMTKLRALHIATIEKIVYYQSIKNNILLHFLYFLSDITLLLAKFHSHFLELENLVPTREKQKLFFQQ